MNKKTVLRNCILAGLAVLIVGVSLYADPTKVQEKEMTQLVGGACTYKEHKYETPACTAGCFGTWDQADGGQYRCVDTANFTDCPQVGSHVECYYRYYNYSPCSGAVISYSNRMGPWYSTKRCFGTLSYNGKLTEEVLLSLKTE